ncbi:hypothetical protein LCGC14_1579500 [marine sediment metagenome]|uniref:Uncharacterized protein n=1 Tax=marine sediment metagenome TaxID=412755 RepID=A0A0F9J3F1_9ZZZZ
MTLFTRSWGSRGEPNGVNDVEKTSIVLTPRVLALVEEQAKLPWRNDSRLLSTGDYVVYVDDDLAAWLLDECIGDESVNDVIERLIATQGGLH